MNAVNNSAVLHAVSTALSEARAVAAFTCYDFGTALAVVGAAEAANRPVILTIAPKFAASHNGPRFIRSLRTLADDAAVPVGVQLDHASDLEVITSAAHAGVDMILADGSSLSFEENIALVLDARERVGPDVVIEAELGGLAGDEDRAFALGQESEEAFGLTDPRQVGEFVERTGAQLLAVAIGNVHGKYTGEPKIHWGLLQRIRDENQVPLVLHGASGIAHSDLRRALTLGVGKVNVNTELRTAVMERVQTVVATHRANGENLMGLLEDWGSTAHNVVTNVMYALQPL